MVDTPEGLGHPSGRWFQIGVGRGIPLLGLCGAAAYIHPPGLSERLHILETVSTGMANIYSRWWRRCRD